MATDKSKLTPEQQKRYSNLEGIQIMASIVGIGLGIIYSKRTGGGFWRGFGYSILGSAIVGIPTALILTPFKNKILKEAESNTVPKVATTTTTTNKATESVDLSQKKVEDLTDKEKEFLTNVQKTAIKGFKM